MNGNNVRMCCRNDATMQVPEMAAMPTTGGDAVEVEEKGNNHG
jgi:hypothetical protein